jgi:hypothetical protein
MRVRDARTNEARSRRPEQARRGGRIESRATEPLVAAANVKALTDRSIERLFARFRRVVMNTDA